MKRFQVATLMTICAVSCVRGGVTRRARHFADGDNSLEAHVINAHPEIYRLNITRALPAVVTPRGGHPLELTCHAHGAPAPTIRWFRNHNPIYEHNIESNELISTNPTSLGRISSTLLVTRYEDQDLFTCLASNGVFTVRSSTVVSSQDSLHSSERQKLYPLAPRIVSTYLAFVDVVGEAVVLPCKAKGHPRPRVTWTINDKPVTMRDPRFKVLHSGELVISPLRWSDTGKVVCRAENIFGTTTTETFLYAAAG